MNKQQQLLQIIMKNWNGGEAEPKEVGHKEDITDTKEQ